MSSESSDLPDTLEAGTTSDPVEGHMPMFMFM
jgi:hypothetical protein